MTSSPMEGEADILGRVLNFDQDNRRMEAAINNNLPAGVRPKRLPIVGAFRRLRQLRSLAKSPARA